MGTKPENYKVGVCKASSLKTKIHKMYYLLQKLEIL